MIYRENSIHSKKKQLGESGSCWKSWINHHRNTGYPNRTYNLIFYEPLTWWGLQKEIEWYNNEFHNFLSKTYCEALIDKGMFKHLNNFPEYHLFYCLHKTHKSFTAPMGQTIVSRISLLTENVSKFVDFYLMLHVTHLPSYMDTFELLKLLMVCVSPLVLCSWQLV